jgi:hypothetical protein
VLSEYNELDALIKAVERQQQVEQVEKFLRGHLDHQKLVELEQSFQGMDLMKNPNTAAEIEENTLKRIELLELCTNMDMTKLLEMALEASITKEPEKESSQQKDRFIDDRDRGR